MKYRFESLNTTKFINLHDCECSRMYYENNKFILEMKWIEVLCSHPKNKFDIAHQSDSGIIEFENPIIIRAEIYNRNTCLLYTSPSPRD